MLPAVSAWVAVAPILTVVPLNVELDFRKLVQGFKGSKLVLYRFITVGNTPVSVKVYVAVILGMKKYASYFITFDAETQDRLTELYTARLEAGSVDSSVPVGVKAVLNCGLRPRFRAAFPAAAVTELAGATTAPSAEQADVMVIRPVLISKKILPLALTITLPLVVGMEGMVIVCVPSLGVLLNKVYGNVKPPSEENRISTLLVLNGAAVVPATVQVIVAVLEPLAVQLVAAACEVTVNAVAPEVDTVISE